MIESTDSSTDSAAIPRGVWHLAVLSGLVYTAGAVYTPVLDRLVREPFGLTNKETSGFFMANVAATLCFAVLFGWMSDRLGRRVPLICAGLAGAGVLTAALPHLHDYQALLWLRFAQGIFETCASVLIVARALDLSGAGNRAGVMGRVAIGIPAGYLMAPVVTGLLGDGPLWILFGLLGASLVVGAASLLPGIASPEKISHRHAPIPARGILAIVLAAPVILIPFMLGIADRVTIGAVAVLTSATMKDVHGITSVRFISMATLAYCIGFIALSRPTRDFCRRFGVEKTLLLGSLAYGAFFAFLGTTSLSLFITLFFLSGAASAVVYIGCIAMIADRCRPEERGLMMGVFNTVGTVGVLLGMPLNGILSTRSYALAWGTSGALMAASAVLAAVLLPVLARRGGRAEPSAR